MTKFPHSDDILSETEYQDSKRQGNMKGYYKSGKPWEEVWFKDGKQSGQISIY